MSLQRWEFYYFYQIFFFNLSKNEKLHPNHPIAT